MSTFNFNSLHKNVALELDPDPEGWKLISTKPFHDGTAKQAALWIAVLIMMSSSLVSFRKISWGDRNKRRLHIFPLIATIVATTFYFLMALGYFGKQSCKSYHLVSSQGGKESDDWQPGAVKGKPRLEVCRLPGGMDWWEWRFVSILWVAQLTTCAENSLSMGSSAFGLITIFDNHGSPSSEQWKLMLKFWPWATGVCFLARSIYQIIRHKDAQSRKFFIKLVAVLAGLYGVQGLYVALSSPSRRILT